MYCRIVINLNIGIFKSASAPKPVKTIPKNDIDNGDV